MLTSSEQLQNIFRSLNETESKYAPSNIFYSGDCSLLSNDKVRVSIIGSRKASQEGIRRSQKLAKRLVENEIVVVSGLAEGIDTASHKGAIEAGGNTIAVIGTPLSTYYPKSNRELQETIARDHLLISQFPETANVNKANFPIRNRFMALISDATVIIEAQDGSGTEHQGWEALRLGRPLWLLKSCVEDTSLTWPSKFIKYGAQVLGDEMLETFFDMLPAEPKLAYESLSAAI